MMLVTLAQARMHLKSDSNADDADLLLKIEAVSESVVEYLKDAATFLNSAGEVDWDSSGDPLIPIPRRVQQATLLWIGYYYDKTRDGAEGDAANFGAPPPAVQNLLWPLRTPTLV